MKSAEHQTRPEDRVSLQQKLGVGVGGLPMQTGALIVPQLAQPIFQIALGLNPVLFGLAMTIPRLLDAFTDPLIGRWSDQTVSRFGRRRPFIFTGALGMALTFIAMWFVPAGWGETGLFVWLLSTSILFFFAFTVYSIPLTSLTYEITPDYHERTRFMAFWAFFATLASLAVSLYPMATQWEGFGNPITGARWVAAIVAVVIFAGVGIIPALVATERFNKKANNECQIGFLEALKQMVSSKPLLLITMVILGLNFCGTIAGSLAQYIAIYYVMGGDVKEGIMLNGLNGVGFSIIGFAGIPVVAWLGTHLGKRRALQLILALATVGGVAKWFIFTPSVPYLLLLDSLLSGPLWVAIGVLVPAMMADLCDADELDYGERREGLIGAVFTWITKVGLSLTFLFSGFVLQFSGFDASVKEQPGDTLTVMRLCFAGASVIAPLVGIVCLHFYSITEERAYKVRALLEQRRGKL